MAIGLALQSHFQVAQRPAARLFYVRSLVLNLNFVIACAAGQGLKLIGSGEFEKKAAAVTRDGLTRRSVHLVVL